MTRSVRFLGAVALGVVLGIVLRGERADGSSPRATIGPPPAVRSPFTRGRVVADPRHGGERRLAQRLCSRHA